MSELRRDYKTSAYKSNVSRINQQKAKRQASIFTGVIVFVFGMTVGLLLSGDGISTDNLTFQQASDISSQERKQDATSDDIEFDQFWEVWDLVRARHVNKDITEEDLFHSAIRGLVAGTGDPYSVYLPPADSEEFQDEINGSFEGIGAEIGIKHEKLTIIAPLSGSPAEAAGVQAGDVILYVDGYDTAYMSVNTAVQYIRGEKGSTVVLTVQRDGVDGPFDVEIVRDTIHIESAKWEMLEVEGQNIAYIQITHFNGDTLQLFNEDVQEIALQQTDGIILDLRNNPGGFLQSAVGIASAFVDEGMPIVYERDNNEQLQELVAGGGQQLVGLPMVVLVNQGSASASEILAGALQDHGIATVVGMQSYGKGTVQELLPFDDGSSLKLTIAEWLTPNQNAINGIGVTPDYEVNRTAEDYSADIDPQLAAAVLFFQNVEEFEQTYAAPAEGEETADESEETTEQSESDSTEEPSE